MDTQPNYDSLLARVKQLEQDLDESKQRIEGLEKTIAGALARTRITKKAEPLREVTIENFVGLKLIHFIGIIVLIIGLSIGVKYAIDINLISPLVRIILAYAAGIMLLLLSYRLRKRFEVFSMILFSGSMASLYFTTYAAYEYYQMLPGWLAFGIMLLLTIFTVYNALKYNRAQIAMLGLVGAYGIPFFVRGNSSDIAMLLLYVLIINLGVLFLSFKKYWPALTYLAFFTSWIIYFSGMYMDDAAFYTASLKLFAPLYFILFLLSGLGFKIYRQISLIDADSILLIINTLLLYAALNLLWAKEEQNLWGLSALVIGICFLVLAVICRQFLPAQKSLNNSLMGISLSAVAAYVALQFSGFNITLIWLVMAIAIFIAGMFFKIKILRLAAIFLFAATLVKLLLIDSTQFTAVQKVTGYVLTGTILLIVSFLYQKFRKRIFEEE
jgi:uncharacterized membrane protein